MNEEFLKSVPGPFSDYLLSKIKDEKEQIKEKKKKEDQSKLSITRSDKSKKNNKNNKDMGEGPSIKLIDEDASSKIKVTNIYPLYTNNITYLY